MKKVGPENAPIKTLMVIDDNEIDHHLVQYTAERSQLVHEIIHFIDAKDALSFLVQEEHSIDVMIVDIHMPRMNGFEFLESAEEMLKDQLANIMVIMLTSSLDSGDVDKAGKMATIKEYCTKPLTTEHLSNFVSYLKEQGQGAQIIM